MSAQPRERTDAHDDDAGRIAEMTSKQREQIRKLIQRYRVEAGKGFALKHIDPGDTHQGDREG
jgi:hypothetical protein